MVVPAAASSPKSGPAKKTTTPWEALDHRLANLAFRFIRAYLDKTFKLCRLNPAGGQAGDFGPRVESRALPLWSHLTQLFYFYFTAKLLASLFLQHHYNVLKHQLGALELQHTDDGSVENFTSAAGAATAQNEDLLGHQRHSELLEKRAQVEASVGHVSLLGNPFYEAGFGAEILFVLVLLFTHLGYAQTRLYVAWCGPVQFGTLQMLLDAERERRLTTGREMARQAGRFLVSSANFWLVERRSALEQAYETLNGLTSGDGGGGGQFFASGRGSVHFNRRAASLRQLCQMHERATRAVRQMLACGELMAPNRAPEWACRVAQLYATLIVLFELSSSGIITLVMLVLPWTGAFHFETHTGPLDLLFLAELFLYCLLGLQAVGSNLIIIMVWPLDLVKFVQVLGLQVAQLAEDVRLMSGGRSSLTSNKTQFGSLDRRLARLLILYKLFCAQLRATQPVVGFMGAHIFFVMLLVPLMGRVYVAYLVREIRLTILAGSIFIILTCDFLVLPCCYLNARCLHLFRRMSSLLAHLDHLQQEQQLQQRQQSPDKEEHQQVAQVELDEHTIWLLRREQNLPEMVARRFATNALFLRLTYSSFMGIHFWCGLLLAPMLLADTGRLRTGGSLLTDSLRLF